MKVSDLDVKIVRANRKTLSIFVERDGSISARVPKDMEKSKIKTILESKEYQIHKNLADWTSLNESKIIREYVNGQSFMYLGRNYRLQLTNNKDTSSLVLKNGYFLFPKMEQKNGKKLFREFYKEKLIKKIEPLVGQYQDILDVKPAEIKVMELRNRWASCTNKSRLNFHWKCAMAPMSVLKYIVIHELVHLMHNNHSSAFWNEVDKLIPNYQAEIQWLRKYGAQMDL